MGLLQKYQQKFTCLLHQHQRRPASNVQLVSASTGFYVPDSSASTEAHMKELVSASTSSGVCVPASASTEVIQKLVSASTGVYVPAASTPIEAHMQELVSASARVYVPASSTAEANMQELVQHQVELAWLLHQNQLRPTCSNLSHHTLSL
jgi:hypothetical protein